MKKRCAWVNQDPLMIEYHDNEWGVPVHDDRLLFEFLALEGAQAGLRWSTILNKRNNYRKLFDNFHPLKVSKYSDRKIEEILQNPGIVRNKLKIHSVVNNAQAILKIQEAYGSFDYYIWQFVNYKPLSNRWKNIKEIPSKTIESENMSRELKKKGFKFVGPTICYAFMQAVGMVNDHTRDCYRYYQLEF